MGASQQIRYTPYRAHTACLAFLVRVIHCTECGFPPPSQALRLGEDVDIKDNGTDGYYVGWTDTDEYLRYSVDVQTEGEQFEDAAVAVVLALAIFFLFFFHSFWY